MIKEEKGDTVLGLFNFMSIGSNNDCADGIIIIVVVEEFINFVGGSLVIRVGRGLNGILVL